MAAERYSVGVRDACFPSQQGPSSWYGIKQFSTTGSDVSVQHSDNDHSSNAHATHVFITHHIHHTHDKHTTVALHCAALKHTHMYGFALGTYNWCVR